MTVMIQFGWGAKSFKEQLPQLPADVAEHFDKDKDAISRLSVRGIITESERDKAMRRTTKLIEEALKKALK